MAAILITVICVVISIWKGLLTEKSITIMVVSLAFSIFLGGFIINSTGEYPKLVERKQ